MKPVKTDLHAITAMGIAGGRSAARTTLMAAAGSGVAAFALYSATLAPGVPATDGGELILAAWSLGIPHPPGFPLWVLAGWIFSHLIPFGSVAWRLNWMSALWGAMAVGVSTAAILWILQRRPDALNKGRIGIPARPAFSVLPAALAAGLCLAASRTLWSWSVVTEVYALHSFLVAAVVLLMFRWRAQLEQGRKPGKAAASSLLPAALLYGLALGNHNITIVALAPAIFYWLAIHRHGLSLRVILRCSLALAGGVLIYAYLPLRAAAKPLLNWGDPSDLTRLWWHISGKQYQVNLLSGGWEGFGPQLWEVLRLFWHQFGPWNLPVLIFGLAAILRWDRKCGVFTLLLVLAAAAYNLAYDIADDRDAYLLNAFLAAAVWLGSGFLELASRALSAFSGRASRMRYALLLLPVSTLAWNWPMADHRHYAYPAVYSENALRQAGAGGIIITADWQLYAPLLARLYVDGQRPDAAAIDVLMLQNRPWYHDHLRRLHPGLLEGADEPANAFLYKLRQFEAGKLSVDDLEIGQRYREFWEALLSSWLKNRPVYMTPDAVAHLRQFGISLDSRLAPEGVMFRMLQEPAGSAARLDPLSWDIAPFLDAGATGRFLDEPARKIRRAHAVMALNRGLYVSRFQTGAGPREMFELALRIDPDYAEAGKMLAGVK